MYEYGYLLNQVDTAEAAVRGTDARGLAAKQSTFRQSVEICFYEFTL